jgi:hypothetical protein
VGRAVLFPSGLLLFFRQDARAPVLGIAFMKVGMRMVDVPELP